MLENLYKYVIIYWNGVGGGGIDRMIDNILDLILLLWEGQPWYSGCMLDCRSTGRAINHASGV